MMTEANNKNQVLNEIYSFEETTQNVAVQCNQNTVKFVRKNSTVVFVTSTPKQKDGALKEKKDTGNEETKATGIIIALGCMLLLFLISITGFFVMWFTEYYDNTVLSQIILANNSETAKSWMEPNPKYDTYLKVHIFNYTNIDQYLRGEEDKIKVEDIGPLTYKEHTVKKDVSFNDNYTVTYRDHRSYEFLPEKSQGRENDQFMLPNVPLLTAAFKVDNMPMWKKFAAVQLIKSFNEKAFKILTAREFLWGYRDRIVSLDFGTGKTHFGLLQNRNGTSVDSLQINTGEDDIRKFGIITQFNGMPYLDFWTDEKCNSINGTDATMFPPHLLNFRDKLYVFLQVLCRKVPLHYEKPVQLYDNINAIRYRTPWNVFAHPSENPENSCYCSNVKRCLPSGVINATKCYNGAPIYPSFPHFYTGDPILYKDFEGIDPQEEKHQTYADIHPRFAFPISGASRIQINIAVHKGAVVKDKIQRIEDGTILPLIWIEITSGDFTEEIIDKLFISTVGLNAIQNALKYGTLLVCITSFGIILAGIYQLSLRLQRSKQISPTTDS